MQRESGVTGFMLPARMPLRRFCREAAYAALPAISTPPLRHFRTRPLFLLSFLFLYTWAGERRGLRQDMLELLLVVTPSFDDERALLASIQIREVFFLLSSSSFLSCS